VRRRIAFIDYFATHYRKRLYEELARRMEVDFYFFADERERYWNRKIPLVRDGDFRRVELRRYRVAGEAVMPGLALVLHDAPLDAVVKSLNGKLMLPLVYGTSRARGLPFVLWTGMWHHPRTALSPRDSAAHAARLPRRRGDRGLRRARRALPRRDGRRRREQGLRGRQAVEARALRVGATGALRRRGGAVRRPVRGAQGLADLLAAFAELGEVRARLRLVGNGSLEPEVPPRGAEPAHGRRRYLPQERLPETLARARCLVLPSVTTDLDREPWGLVVNEAMHAGVPVIATETVGAGLAAWCSHDRNGLVVPERNPLALGEAIRRLAQ
jgi:glycosyltransferase involved in cell wall biosynthesis